MKIDRKTKQKNIYKGLLEFNVFQGEPSERKKKLQILNNIFNI